jgi:hypothetical protein
MNMKKLCSLFVAASMLLLVGCEIKYNGVAVQLNNECAYILDEELLASLELSGGVDVVVDTAMAKNKVRVVSNTDDFSKLVVKAENGRLLISSKRNLGNVEYKAYVPAFGYNAVAVAGGCDLEWDCCDVDELTVSVSGGADCEVKGRCNTLTLVVSGGADVDFDELLADDVSVVASGGADVELHAVKSITVTALSGSDISIVGNPQIRGWNVSGGADVSLDR